MEIEDLLTVAIRERDRYKESTQLMSDGISAIPMLAVNDSVCLIVINGTHFKLSVTKVFA